MAVPANLRCGAPENPEAVPAEPDWAPLTYSYAGFWEVEPTWLEEHRADVSVIDVRDAQERTGPLGHIAESLHVPLAELSAPRKAADP